PAHSRICCLVDSSASQKIEWMSGLASVIHCSPNSGSNPQCSVCARVAPRNCEIFYIFNELECRCSVADEARRRLTPHQVPDGRPPWNAWPTRRRNRLTCGDTDSHLLTRSMRVGLASFPVMGDNSNTSAASRCQSLNAGWYGLCSSSHS